MTGSCMNRFGSWESELQVVVWVYFAYLQGMYVRVHGFCYGLGLFGDSTAINPSCALFLTIRAPSTDFLLTLTRAVIPSLRIWS